jgi:hypothetical protein
MCKVLSGPAYIRGKAGVVVGITLPYPFSGAAGYRAAFRMQYGKVALRALSRRCV